MKAPKVSRNAWKALYAAAVRFRDLAPWNYMDDGQLFGVQDPVSGESGYCCVMGALGQVMGLCVYRGHEGLALYRRLQSGELGTENPDIFAMQNALFGEFCSRSELEKEDLQVIKSLKLTFRGSGKWPLFRSHLPGFCPWFLDEAEVRFLAVAFECACDMAARCRKTPSIMEVFDEQRLAVYVPVEHADGEAVFEIQNLVPEMPPETENAVIAVNELKVRKLKSVEVRQDSAWEADAFFLPGALISEGERPYYGRIVMVVHRESGYIFYTNIVHPQSDYHADMAEGLLDACARLKAVPSEVFFRDDMIAAAFEPLRKSLGFKVKVSKHLPAVDEARAEFARQVFSGFPDIPA